LESQFKAKYEGGLGFREMHLFNKAMLAKQVWRLKTDPNSLLGQCIKARYYPHSDIFQAQQGRQASYAWQSIHQAIGTIKKGSCWKTISGRTTGWCGKMDSESTLLTLATTISILLVTL
jgi:hypothetical protein